MMGLVQKMSKKINALCRRVHVRREDYNDPEQTSIGGIANISPSGSGGGFGSRSRSRTKTVSASVNGSRC